MLSLSTIRGAPVGGGARRRSPLINRGALAARTTPAARATPEKAPEHFEPADKKFGECLLEDARDAMEACKGLSPEDEAACMLQHGCDAAAVHARLDAEEEGVEATADGAKEAAAAGAS